MRETDLEFLIEHTLDLMWETQNPTKVNQLHWDGDKPKIVTMEKLMRPIDFTTNPHEFALKIHQKDPHAPLSPYYFNLRNLPHHFNVDLAMVIALATRDLEFDCFAGIPNAADEIADIFWTFCPIHVLPAKIFGKTTTEQGRKITALESAPKGRGRKLLILDDVISHAETKFEAIEVAQCLDYQIAGIATAFDRQEGGRELLEAAGHTVVAPIEASYVFSRYYRKDNINRGLYDDSMHYLNSSRMRFNLPPIFTST